jgi:hypothetical protein
MRLLHIVAFDVCLLFSMPASAQILPPFTNLRVAPSPAHTGEPVMAVLSGFCVANPGPEHVLVQGDVITLTHVVESLCGVPLPPMDYGFPLGSFAPGTYTLVYAPTSGRGIDYEVQSVHFSVLGGIARVAVPIDSWRINLLLALMVLGIGSRHQCVEHGRRAGTACGAIAIDAGR